MTRLEPLKFRPSLREKIWGTRDLAPLFGRKRRRIGEAWCIHDGSEVDSGPLRGRTVTSLVAEFGQRLMGPHWNRAVRAPYARPVYQDIPRDTFPVLGKLLFGAGQLSVQVHPDNETARSLEGGLGKPELWYVIAAEPDARLGLGLEKPLEPAQLASAATDGSIERLLRWIPAVPGECVLVPAGTVHCAGGGVVLCEIQQNSDITYRLHDYGRNGLDGAPRALQVDRAVASAKTHIQPQPRMPEKISVRPCLVERLDRCSAFVAELLSWDHPFVYSPDPKRCQALICVCGAGTLNGIPFDAGDAFLIPADSPRFLVDGSGARAVRAYLP